MDIFECEICAYAQDKKGLIGMIISAEAISPEIAIHPSLDKIGWTVTHVPSGHAFMRHINTRSNALEVAKKFCAMKGVKDLTTENAAAFEKKNEQAFSEIKKFLKGKMVLI